jgi:hypothetical protein
MTILPDEASAALRCTADPKVSGMSPNTRQDCVQFEYIPRLEWIGRIVPGPTPSPRCHTDHAAALAGGAAGVASPGGGVGR